MRRFTLAAAIAALIIGTSATASAQSVNCRQNNGAAGTVVGALVGATAGGVIANNSRSYRGHRGFRGNRGFRGHRGYRGNRGFRGHRGFRGSRRGNQEVGIIAGALIGGLIGNQVASSNARNCQTVVGPNTYRGDPYANRGFQNNQVLAGGNIDHNAARLGDPYGGRQVISGQQVSQANQPVAPQNTQVRGQQQGSALFKPVCRSVERVTAYPDGQRVTEDVNVCQYSQGGEWIEQ